MGSELVNEEALGEMFGVGVGEGEGVVGEFGGGAGGEEVLVFEGGGVGAAAAERVDGLGDGGLDVRVEGVEVGVGVRGGDVGKVLEVGGGEGEVGELEAGFDDRGGDQGERAAEVDGGCGVDVDCRGGSDVGNRIIGQSQLGLLDVSIENSDSVLVDAEPLKMRIGQYLEAKGPKAPVCVDVVSRIDTVFLVFSIAHTLLHLGQAAKDCTESW